MRLQQMTARRPIAGAVFTKSIRKGRDMTPIETVRAALNHLSARDFPAFTALMHEDAVKVSPFAPSFAKETLKGRAEWEPVLRGFMIETLKEFTWFIDELYEVPGTGVVFGIGRSRGLGKDGREYANKYAWLFNVTDGKISRFVEFYNPKAIEQFFAGAAR
jgi:ketosteroid isomerase-like protein